MTQVSGFDKTPVKSEDGTRDSGWTEEHDCIPLKHRLKLLLASNRLSNIGAAEAANDASSVSTPPVNSVIKREQQQCDSRGFVSACFEGDGRVGRLSGEQNLADQSEVYDTDVSAKWYIPTNKMTAFEINAGIAREGSLNACVHSALQHVLSEDSTNVNVKCDDNRLTSSLANSATGFSGSRVGAMKIKPKFPDDVLDHLDHISMKERQMMLLSRRSQRLTQIAFEGMSPELSSAAVNVMNEPSAAITKRESYSDDNESSAARNHGDDILKTECQSSNDTIAVPSCTTHQCLALPHLSEQSNATTYVKKNGRICSSGNFFPQNESRVVPDVLSGNHMASPSSAFIKVKVESVDINNSRSQDMSTAVNFSFGTMGPVKSELEITDEPFGDRIDHMLLRERMKLLASLPDMGISGNADCVRNIVPSVLDSKPIASKSTKPPRVNRPRKKRKTATDSIETALEEDAPGLLKVLIDKGVSLTEIKLYGETESNEAFDDSCIEESFSELEDVISKLVFQRESHLKLTPVRCSKGEKACYYLASLISLVEQARYLQFRKWPVEWGWCRDLQSFIFVFERHNRIVLERPEYGYATYFFELVDSLPIDWQIKRLVTTMKLTSCSRVTLIENKALMVAEDLSEGEARVLMEYGWMPNSGLGTMLNYRDRVVHDRKNDGETSEWRSKIGKLLMDGYHGGTIFYTELPKRVMEYNSPEVKLEF